jgi:hypothetical protein
MPPLPVAPKTGFAVQKVFSKNNSRSSVSPVSGNGDWWPWFRRPVFRDQRDLLDADVRNATDAAYRLRRPSAQNPWPTKIGQRRPKAHSRARHRGIPLSRHSR